MPTETAAPHAASPERRFHLDRRAGEIAEKGAGDGDDLLSTSDVAEWLSVSNQWLEIGRCSGYGPEFIRLSPRRVRYRRCAVLAWLAARSHASTREYDSGSAGRKRGSRVVDGRVVVAPAEAADA